MPEPATPVRSESLPPAPSACAIATTSAGGSGRRPGPNSPQAIGPSSGGSRITPLCARIFWLATVASCSHIRTFMAGAARILLSVASRRVVARSSQMPAAILARMLALAGTTAMRSAERESSMWPISDSSVRLNKSVKTLLPERAWTERGVTKCFAESVRTAVTAPPDFWMRRMSSSALYAAMPPEMMSRIFLPARFTAASPGGWRRCRRTGCGR